MILEATEGSYGFIFVVFGGTDGSIGARADILEVRVASWNHPVGMADRLEIEAFWNVEPIVMAHHNLHPIVIPLHF